MSGSLIGAIIAGVGLTAVAFAHPIGPALMLFAITPFDAIPFALFNVLGNLITYVPISIFLIRMNPVAWGQVFLGTRIQQLAALFVMALLVSHAAGILEHGINELLGWMRKVTLFLLMAIFAFALREEKHVALAVRVTVFSFALFTLASMSDFYLGIQVLPVKIGEFHAEGALATEYTSYIAGEFRFTGAGFPVNRYSNYLLLPILLGVGWFMRTRRPFERVLAMGCTGILVLGELLTATRSGILGLFVGGLILLPMAFRFRPQQVIGIAVVGGGLAAAVSYGLSLTSGEEVLAGRFEVEHVIVSTSGRIERYVAAFKIWAENPFIGVGWGEFKAHSWRYIAAGGKSAHNGYLNILAETGLLGFIPLMLLLATVSRRYMRTVRAWAPDIEFWRPYFLAAFVAQIVTNVFNDYLWERYFWLSFAFAVMLENVALAARAEQSRAGLQAARELAFRPRGPATARAPLR